MKKFLVALAILGALPLAAQADEDAHFLQPDDYFVADEEFKAGWIRVYLAKMKTPPTKETKNEGEFIKVDGSEVWTKIYYKTRIATKDEVKVGQLMIALDVADDNSVYIAPTSKDEARDSSWFLAKIVDVSDAFKGYVKVSGGYKVKLDNIRIIEKK